MGKNLKGREIGEGLSQRKDGRYSARFTNKAGKRVEKYFSSLNEAKSWLADARYKSAHEAALAPFEMVASLGDGCPSEMSEMTVDEWYTLWMDTMNAGLAWNTRRNYRDRYVANVKPLIGNMRIRDVKALHCRKILADMDADYAGSTIRQTYIMMGTMFKSAKMNDVIVKHPMDGVRCTKAVRKASAVRYLTASEQELFLQVAKRSHNYRQYAFVLETGLRMGELVGLTWDAVNFQNRTITVNKTLEYRHSRGEWYAGAPKTPTSYRAIPLTTRAYQILLDIYNERDTQKRSPQLEQELRYTDRYTGETISFCMKDLVFINWRVGMPAKSSSYDTHLYKLCQEAGIKPFSMHALRHTFATRAIERGVPPKVLQQLLGHASIKTTMDTYVHVSDGSKLEAIKLFEAACG